MSKNLLAAGRIRLLIRWSTADWEPQTFHDSLKTTLVDSGIRLPGLKDGIALLAAAAKKLAKK